MNPDEYDFRRHKPSVEPNNEALYLFRALEHRCVGQYKKITRNKENLEIYAEDEFIRKKFHDELRCEMPGHARSTFLMVFSSDGTKIASTHGNHNIYITDMKTGKNIHTLTGHPRTPWCIAFHPTSNQILASGCLGGEVRIWDLSGGSEVWTAGSQSVIASLAFHPNDRILVIATYNQLFFWDWSMSTPFAHIATSNPKEKIRYVAFDKLGHKLITGIANSPQTRWERVRAPVPVPRQAERSASPYRLRITPRLVYSANSGQTGRPVTQAPTGLTTREVLSSVSERERRITTSYRNLLREYEQLVQRYLKIYKPPTMIDRGTDPMESTASTAADSSGSSSASQNNPVDPQPSTSQSCSSSLVMPSRILAMKKQPTEAHSTQTSDSRKHKTTDHTEQSTQEKRSKCDESASASTSSPGPSTSGSSHIETATQTQSPRKVLVINDSSQQSEASTNGGSQERPARNSGVRVLCPKTSKRKSNTEAGEGSSSNEPQPSTSRGTSSTDDVLPNIRPLAEEARSRFLPIINSLPPCDRPKLIKRFENNAVFIVFNNSAEMRAHERAKSRAVCPPVTKKPNRRPVLDTSSDSSSSDDEQSSVRTRLPPDVSNQSRSQSMAPPTSASVQSNAAASSGHSFASVSESLAAASNSLASASNNLASSTQHVTHVGGVSNFINELEQLLMSILTTECANTTETNTASASGENDSPLNLNASVSSTSSVTNQDESNTSNQPLRLSPVYITNNRDQDLIRPSAVTLDNVDTNNVFQRMIQWTESVNNPVNLDGLPPSPPRNEPLFDMPSPISGISSPIRSPVSTGPVVSTDLSPISSPLSEIFSQTSRMPPAISRIPSSTSGIPPVSEIPSGATSPMYNRFYPRRRLAAHRISAFMPTRVNYNRTSLRSRRASPFRIGARLANSSTFSTDEVINFSERPNAEDNVPQDNQPPENSDNATPSYNINNYLSPGLEPATNDMRNGLMTNRSNDTTDMLSSFSESLENIMNQSDTILRNLGGSMSRLPSYSEPTERRQESNEPRVSFNDQNFYIRSSSSPESPPRTDNRSLDANSVIESDHNYPRIPETNQNQSSGDPVSPLMTSLHMTISYIQRQARLLRHQVDSIERIDRTMFEVEQLQLIRHLITEFLRYIRSLAGESRSTGMSSVRQMMAGTRISDSSPYDSQSEEQSQQNPRPSTSTASTSTEQTSTRPRSSGRKTYPPSRLMRLQRQRRSLFFFPRRYAGRPERGVGHPGPRRSSNSLPPDDADIPLRNMSGYTFINSSSLNLMTRRLEHLLTEQTRLITRPQEVIPPSNSRSATNVTELTERNLSARLTDCAVRVNRLLGNAVDLTLRNRSEPVVVTPDGASRYGARHFLSLILDGMSKHIEQLGGGNISQTLRGQIQSVLAMGLLLSDLLLLQLVDSIPPPAGMNLDVERESLTVRIDQMCGQMLQNRFSTHSHQLTRSLQHMRLTMRRAYRALGQTYNARRNAMLPNRPDPNRRQLLNRYLRNMNMRRHSSNLGTDPTTSSSDTNAGRDLPNPESSANDNMTRGWSNLRDLILRYSDNAGEDEYVDVTSVNEENPFQRMQRFENASSNNSDDNDDESEWYVNNNSRSTNLYRTNNVNLVHNNNEESASNSNPNPNPNSNSSRPWNVPSVQVNDVPISEQPSLFHQRMMSHRQRLAERVSELRTFPQMSGLRPRFLHPLYASVNPFPFDGELDDPQREANYDCDMITTVTPNHRIQMWDISSGNIPCINNPMKNVIVSECKIHNDASVDTSNDGTILVTLLPSGGYLNITNKLGVYSLKWESLGQLLYTTTFEQNAVSVSLSPLSRHLVVGLASRRVSIVPTDRWTMARIFIIDQKNVSGDRLPLLRELSQNREPRGANFKSINCIRWLPVSGQGLIYATNTGQLVMLS